MVHKVFVLQPSPHPSRQRAVEAVQNAPDGYVVTVGEATRSSMQNSKLWALLSEVSEQVDWHGNKLSPEEWKHVFSAALSKQKVVHGIDGGFVVLGQSTSRMSKKELSDLVELIYAFGTEKGVRFNERLERSSRTPSTTLT